MGNTAPDKHTCNSELTSLYHPSPIGIFPVDSTEEGISDMGGNVSEWCLDLIDTDSEGISPFYKKSAEEMNPVNNASFSLGFSQALKTNRSEHVIRGGAWICRESIYFRCTYRNYSDPFSRFNFIGFRIVLNSQELHESKSYNRGI